MLETNFINLLWGLDLDSAVDLCESYCQTMGYTEGYSIHYRRLNYYI